MYTLAQIVYEWLTLSTAEEMAVYYHAWASGPRDDVARRHGRVPAPATPRGAARLPRRAMERDAAEASGACTGELDVRDHRLCPGSARRLDPAGAALRARHPGDGLHMRIQGAWRVQHQSRSLQAFLPDAYMDSGQWACTDERCTLLAPG